MTTTQAESTFVPPLQIAVIGAGGIGSALAFQLARTGRHTVTAIARAGSVRLGQLQRDEAIVDDQGQRAPLRVDHTLDEQTAYDLAIVTVQAHRLDAVLPMLERSAAKCFLFMFNNFDPQQLTDILGAERCCFGMPFLQAVIAEDGRLKATIGAGGQKSKLGHQHWVDIFNAAGLPSSYEQDMPLWLRCHVPMCIAFESASVAGVRRAGGASWGEATVIAQGVKESFALIRGLGYQLYPSGKARLGASPTWVVAAILWFVTRIRPFRELLAKGIDECRALVDVLVASAPRANPAVSIAKIQAMKPINSERT